MNVSFFCRKDFNKSCISTFVRKDVTGRQPIILMARYAAEMWGKFIIVPSIPGIPIGVVYPTG